MEKKIETIEEKINDLYERYEFIHDGDLRLKKKEIEQNRKIIELDNQNDRLFRVIMGLVLTIFTLLDVFFTIISFALFKTWFITVIVNVIITTLFMSCYIYFYKNMQDF